MDGLEFNVSTLLRQDVGVFTDHVVETADSLDLDGLVTRHIAGRIRLTRTNFGVLAHARLDTALDLECDRCLDQYETHVLADFSEEYLPVIDVSTGRPVQSERSDETFFISPNHIVDLTEAARQYTLLAVPMHRICRNDCRGLCAICGVNKNTTNCTCAVVLDSPLSALAVLLTDADKES